MPARCRTARASVHAVGRALPCAILTACANPLPGTELGTYTSSAALTGNSCGVAAPNPWTFDVAMSRQGSTLYWSWMDSNPVLSGPLDAQWHATLTTSQQANVDPSGGVAGPCNMIRNDTVVVSLDPASPPASFQGTLRYALSAASGSDCSDQLVVQGGQYATLPCTIAYTMAGVRQ